MLTKSAIYLRIALVLAIVIIVNVLFNLFPIRLDFTGDQRYTLSQATKDILSNLDEPVTVTAYFSENLPPGIQKVRQDFQEMLVEYSSRSGGNVAYEFINPNASQETEMAAQQAGVQPISINVRERDQMKQQRAYLGAKLQYGEDSEIIPIIQPGAAMEYALSSSIKKISVTNKPKVGFVTDRGCAGINTMQQALQSLSILYNVEPVSLSDSALLTDYKALAIIAPTDTFSAAEISQLDAFLGTGKGIVAALNSVDAQLQAGSGKDISTGLETWLESKGVQVDDNLVVDANCGAVSVQQQGGDFFSRLFRQQVKFPFLPIISEFADHTITKGLEQISLPFVSTVSYLKKDTAHKFTPLVYSSQKSGMQPAPITFDINKQWGDQDFVTSNLVLGGTLEGKLSGDVFSKMVIFGDGDFAINGEEQQAQRQGEDNISLLVNAIDWLSDDTGLNELRTKGVTSRPIKKELSDGERTMVKYGNFLLPIFLIALYGFIRAQVRRAKRRKWASERYV